VAVAAEGRRHAVAQLEAHPVPGLDRAEAPRVAPAPAPPDVRRLPTDPAQRPARGLPAPRVVELSPRNLASLPPNPSAIASPSADSFSRLRSRAVSSSDPARSPGLPETPRPLRACDVHDHGGDVVGGTGIGGRPEEGTDGTFGIALSENQQFGDPAPGHGPMEPI